MPRKYDEKMLGICDENVRIKIVKVKEKKKEIIKKDIKFDKLI